MIDPRFFCPPEYLAHRLGNVTGARPWPLQHHREDLPNQGDRQPRIFFPHTGVAPVVKTTRPARSGSCDGASPSSCAPRSAPNPLLVCLLQTTARSGASPRGPPQWLPATPPWERCSAHTSSGGSSRYCKSPPSVPVLQGGPLRPWSAPTA